MYFTAKNSKAYQEPVIIYFWLVILIYELAQKHIKNVEKAIKLSGPKFSNCFRFYLQVSPHEIFLKSETVATPTYHISCQYTSACHKSLVPGN